MSFRSAPMQYLMSKMSPGDRGLIGQSAENMGDFARYIAERSGGLLTAVKGKFNPATPSTMAPGTPGAPSTPGGASSSSYMGEAAPGTPMPGAPSPLAEMRPVPETPDEEMQLAHAEQLPRPRNASSAVRRANYPPPPPAPAPLA